MFAKQVALRIQWSLIGTGFSFANYNAHEMMDTIRRAERVYYSNRDEWNKMAERAMTVDFSWDVSAMKYQEMYDWLAEA